MFELATNRLNLLGTQLVRTSRLICFRHRQVSYSLRTPPSTEALLNVVDKHIKRTLSNLGTLKLTALSKEENCFEHSLIPDLSSSLHQSHREAGLKALFHRPVLSPAPFPFLRSLTPSRKVSSVRSAITRSIVESHGGQVGATANRGSLEAKSSVKRCHVARCHVSQPLTELRRVSPISSAKTKSNQRFATVSAPSRLEMQLLEQESSSCFAKSGGAKICGQQVRSWGTEWTRSTGINLEHAVPERARTK